MKTRINFFDHASGLRDTIEVPLCRDIAVNRLRLAIGEPEFEVYGEDDGIAIYARIDVSPIAVHLFSYSAAVAAGARNELVGTLTGRALT